MMYRFATFVLFLTLGIAVQLSHGTEVNVRDKDNNLCLYANLMVNFKVSYEVAINKSSTAEFELPASVTSGESTCGETSSTLNLHFGDGHSWSVNFTTDGKMYWVDTITFSYNLSDAIIFPNSTSTDTTTIYAKSQIKDVRVDTCYSCKSKETIETAPVSQMLQNVLIQAFVGNNSKSEEMTSCAADVPTTPVAPTTHTPTTTTTQAPTTAPKTTTTHTPTTTTTHTPTTTTDAPVTNATTTDAPVTNATTTDAPVTNSTTTDAPVTNSTTAAPPTPTPTPTLPAPTTGKYKIQPDVNHTACLLADFGLRFKVKEEEMNFEPNGTAVTGKCEVNSSELVLTSKTATIKLTFTNDTKKFHLHALNVTGKTSSGVAFSAANTNLSLWEAAVGSSYMCNKEQNYTISADLSIYTFELRVQPFAVKKGVFSTAEECFLDTDLSFLVPIAVGVALSFLIILVLISYLIGRRKSRTGYQSV
ncbi:lysosome-associated membrane glycoprotein 2 isoform X2 [Eleginops maclovinus]|uniref:lysosome-associated membrane glycoprotein 2 isoform X2 n=1 Tax=Eleginops maclovinus TaxID=56733 RepID=UPI0030804977